MGRTILKLGEGDRENVISVRNRRAREREIKGERKTNGNRSSSHIDASSVCIADAAIQSNPIPVVGTG